MKENQISRREFLKLSALTPFALGIPSRFIRNPEYLTPGGEYEVFHSEPLVGQIEAHSLPVIFVPLRKDSFYDEKKPISEWNISGIAPGFNRLMILKGPNLEFLEVATMHHVTGERAVPLAIVAKSRINSLGEKESKEVYGAIKPKAMAEFSMMDSFYPNKIHNLLEFSAQMIRRQLESGPFKAGQEYSLLDILSLSSDHNFKTGLTSTKKEVKGGGICGGATTLAHTLEQLDVEFEEIQPHSHYSLYWVGPLDPEINVTTDATIEEGLQDYDFRWKMPAGKDLYFSATPVIAIFGEPQPNGLGEANARIFLSFSFSETRPESAVELKRIEDLQKEYALFNSGRGIGPNLNQATLVTTADWGVGSPNEKISKAVFPEEDISGFTKELEDRGYLADIDNLKDLVNSYKEAHPAEKFAVGESPRLGDYIKESSWYLGLTKSKKEAINSSLGHINYYTYWYKNQPLQCIGWVILLASLGYRQSPQDISGAAVGYARELIPDSIRLDRYRESWQNGFHTLKVTSLDEINVGDLFLTYELMFNDTPGHIAAIVDKKVIDGETVLLAADANRKDDGLVRMFKIHRGNMYGVLGIPPKKWIVIRK